MMHEILLLIVAVPVGIAAAMYVAWLASELIADAVRRIKK